MTKRKELKFKYVPYKEYTEEEILQAEQDKQKVIDYIYKKIILENSVQLVIKNETDPDSACREIR